MNQTGRPEYTDDQYQAWLDEMAPFLKMGVTLNGAINDAGLQKHRTSLYEKYSLNDWSSDKIDVLREYPGKIANNILVKRVMLVDEKIKQGLPVSDDEMKDVRFMAEKHRSSKPYFVTRHEVAKAEEVNIGELLDTIEKTNYEELAQQAAKEMERQQSLQTPPQS